MTPSFPQIDQGPEMSEFSNKHKHLEFIQASIGRMSGNLFLLKGWSVTLIAALFALAAKDTNKAYIVVAYFPLFIFWFLDGYFLAMERRFRSLYEHVRQLKEEDIDFSMNTEPYKIDSRNQWFSALFSRTLFPYYITLGLLMILLSIFIH
ncbi:MULTISPECIES: hypothetical protein [unclassified Duganella]|jgi:uncharacterized membrane protein|uniref:hypothetical protein n=1 Tax=unclassified Duganella TaxID=2636909 RepID=UPI0008921E89|nr:MULTISPECIES: hypothetical protein [unclassified Duganella]SDG83419.1 hypothetical protein SAMN05216320_107232 [Duganella sp. OV458]SDK10839.1 hypothetical protein SAMN05428973_108233 [Duganella sp. OV510]